MGLTWSYKLRWVYSEQNIDPTPSSLFQSNNGDPPWRRPSACMADVEENLGVSATCIMMLIHIWFPQLGESIDGNREYKPTREGPEQQWGTCGPSSAVGLQLLLSFAIGHSGWGWWESNDMWRATGVHDLSGSISLLVWPYQYPTSGRNTFWECVD